MSGRAGEWTGRTLDELRAAAALAVELVKVEAAMYIAIEEAQYARRLGDLAAEQAHWSVVESCAARLADGCERLPERKRQPKT